MDRELLEKIIASRPTSKAMQNTSRKLEAEGGCGVIGIACAEKVAGRHLMPSLQQMCNRGNGKGGGIAAAGLSPQQFGVTPEILKKDYLIAIAYLDNNYVEAIEKEYIHALFEVDHIHAVETITDYRQIKGLLVKPPEVKLYFVRVKEESRDTFCQKNQLEGLSKESIEDEIVYQNSFQLNQVYYAAAAEKKAFVLSHGKDLLVLKMVGYADDLLRYYLLETVLAHVWIGHHRYPTKGKVWHPGGAHPFIGLHEALVHNGDLANYYSLCEYLAQRGIQPLFLTDTEAAALLFDLLHRTYRYPLEYLIEVLAPTTQRDFTLLPEEKQYIYRQLQTTHMHGSPDGPWFFLIAQSLQKSSEEGLYRLIGVTDTSMLRPQVFALQQGSVPIGLAASEKQAIDATLRSLSEEDPRFWPEADYYWNARGGSHTDGGAFIFTVRPKASEGAELECVDKFGLPVHTGILKPPFLRDTHLSEMVTIPEMPINDFFIWVKEKLLDWNYEELESFLHQLVESAFTDQERTQALELLTKLIDQIYPMGRIRRSSLRVILTESLAKLAQKIKDAPSQGYSSMSFDHFPLFKEGAAVFVDAAHFPSEGAQSLAAAIIHGYSQGVKHWIIYNCRGQRFIGNGLGPSSKGVKIDLFGSSGDYTASGIDGAEVHLHGSGQDQLAQIMNGGKLVVFGDVGQTFMYGAKGGVAFIRGNAAGRPLINAVGNPRVVINGTALDYLAESFMAGDPLREGGFVIINGLYFDQEGKIAELKTPYPGSNLFSLASGGAIYLRDPRRQVALDQLNGGQFVEMSEKDWQLILPYLEENARLFGISLDKLLEVESTLLSYQQVYRKIVPQAMPALQGEEAWVKGR